MRIRILFILLMTTYVSYSQISGQVIDANNTPIPFANVILYNDLTKELTKGVITSETGAFYIDDIPDGHYTVQIHLISYQTWNSESFAFAKADTKKSCWYLRKVALFSTAAFTVAKLEVY